MVVASIVHLNNYTLRTFRLTPGDPFYTPQVAGRPHLGDIDVPPGFEQPAEGLVVPWESMSRTGFVVADKASKELVRCTVGPNDSDSDDKDWLRFHSESWQPLAQERWVPLGPRHVFMGLVGNQAELQLTFRDARSLRGDAAELAELLHFDRAIACASVNAVFLNVFDLASAVSVPNAVLNNSVVKSLGAFHAAVQVYNEEWSFYRTPNPDSCGVAKSLRPRHHPVHVFRQSVNLGTTELSEWEVRYLIRSKLAPQWRGGSYDLLRRNCIHFCDELLLALGAQPVPDWVCGLHETGASIMSPLSWLFGWGDGYARAVRDRSAEEEKQAINSQAHVADMPDKATPAI